MTSSLECVLGLMAGAVVMSALGWFACRVLFIFALLAFSFSADAFTFTIVNRASFPQNFRTYTTPANGTFAGYLQLTVPAMSSRPSVHIGWTDPIKARVAIEEWPQYPLDFPGPYDPTNGTQLVVWFSDGPWDGMTKTNCTVTYTVKNNLSASYVFVPGISFEADGIHTSDGTGPYQWSLSKKSPLLAPGQSYTFSWTIGPAIYIQVDGFATYVIDPLATGDALVTNLVSQTTASGTNTSGATGLFASTNTPAVFTGTSTNGGGTVNGTNALTSGTFATGLNALYGQGTLSIDYLRKISEGVSALSDASNISGLSNTASSRMSEVTARSDSIRSSLNSLTPAVGTLTENSIAGGPSSESVWSFTFRLPIVGTNTFNLNPRTNQLTAPFYSGAKSALLFIYVVVFTYHCRRALADHLNRLVTNLGPMPSASSGSGGALPVAGTLGAWGVRAAVTAGLVTIVLAFIPNVLIQFVTDTAPGSTWAFVISNGWSPFDAMMNAITNAGAPAFAEMLKLFYDLLSVKALILHFTWYFGIAYGYVPNAVNALILSSRGMPS